MPKVPTFFRKYWQTIFSTFCLQVIVSPSARKSGHLPGSLDGANGPLVEPIRRCILVCLGVGLLLASASSLPAQVGGRIGRKLNWLEGHKDNFDVVFVGSSRVFHGLSPRIFDQVAAANGFRCHSFNLGMDSMGMAQSMDVIRDLVSTQPRNLKYVIFELEPGTGMLAGGQSRSVQRPPDPPVAGNGLGPEGNGFFPMARSMSPSVEPFYQERLAAVRANPGPKQPNEVARTELNRFYQEMAAHNIQVIFLVAPSLREAHGSGVNAPAGTPLISFDDLVRYAPLYDEENRMDAEHLNARGAEIFSRLLAQEFVAKTESMAR
jgi:hypothetical protein